MTRRSSSFGSRSLFIGRGRGVRAGAAITLAAAMVSSSAHAAHASAVLARAVQAADAEAPSPPSLILPGSIDPSEGGRSAMSLRELVELVGGSGAVRANVAEAAAPDAAAAERATRRYVEGRAAYADGKYLVAVRALDDALNADPSSLDIRRALARAYARAGNQPKSMQLYEDVLKRDPADVDALLALGFRAADQADADAAIRHLGALFLLDQARRKALYDDVRPGTEAIAELALSRALRQVGADAATIEVLSRTVVRSDAEIGERARGEARRALGDAQARRGDVAAALGAWTSGATGANASGDPINAGIVSAIMEPRITWGLVALGRDGEAIGRLRSRVAAAGASDVDVALAAWLRAVVRDATPLTRWARELPEGDADAGIARLRCALTPETCTLAASRSLDRRVLRDGFARDVRAGRIEDAIRAAIEVVRRDPLAMDAVAAALLQSGADAPALLRTAAAAGASGAAIHARLRCNVNDAGEAWRIATEARRARPEDADLLRESIHAAGALSEPGFLEELSRAIAPDDAASLVELARAWRACDEPARAEDAARRAAERAASASPPDRRVESAALVALSQAQADAAARSADRRRANDAVTTARGAVSSDPSNELAWMTLVRLLDALAAGDGDDRATRRNDANQARADAIKALPDSALARHIAIERLFNEGAMLDGIHAAVAFAAADPVDSDVLRLAASGLTRLGKVDSALAVIDEHLAETPADPVAWQLWTEATIAAGRADQALERVASRADAPTSDPIAAPLKELALRAAGREADADVAAAERMARLPPSPRRDLEKAAQALGRGDNEAAARALDSASANAKTLPVREALAAAELAFRLGDARERARLVRAFAGVVLASTGGSEPVEPVVVARAAALVALEADPKGDPQGEFRRMAEIAVRAAKGGVGAGEVPAWVAIGQSFADRGRPEDGAAFLAALLRSEARIDPMAAARLAGACFALDAAAGGGAERSIALLDLLRSRGVRPFARADRAEATDADALQLLSGLYSVIGDRRGSVAILREAVARDPKHAMSANNLAWNTLENGRVDAEAIALAERALALQPDDPAILDTVGWLRYLQGQIDDKSDGGTVRPGAVSLLRRAIERAGEDPGADPLDHLGDALWRAGDRDGAVRAWRAAAQIIELKYPKDQMSRTLAAYERREHGVSVADIPAFWKRNYGDTLERAKKKLAQAARGEEPSVAPFAAGP